MRRSARRTAAVLAASALAAAPALSRAAPPGPPPPVILGGEVYNSSSSSAAHMETLWPRLDALWINTLIAPVAWDQIEPQEGRFDFASVDALLAQARAHRVRLALLWLGAFKNAKSTYAPSWVRADRFRFPRVGTRQALEPSGASASTPPPVLSAFAPATLAADARAFSALAVHLKAADTDGRLALLQVENETGLLGDSRDRSPLAEAAWRRPVPAALLQRLRSGRVSPVLARAWAAQGRPSAGDWARVFGEGPVADEAFMAWHVARYVEQVAQAGRPALAVPFYTNAWLGPQPGETQPGQYPSGGPTAAMIEVWKAAAPTLAFVSPDIYVTDAKSVQAAYDRPDNRLFIPENAPRAGELFWALGAHGALGVSVFGVDSLRPGGQTAQALGALSSLADLIARAQAEGRIAGVLLDGEETQTVELGGLTLTFRGADAFWRRQALDAGARPPPEPPPGASETDGFDTRPDRRAFGLVVAEGPGRFLFVGQGFLVDATRDGKPVEYDRVEEGTFRDGRWIPGRLLNGDDYAQVVPRDRIGMTRTAFLPWRAGGAAAPRTAGRSAGPRCAAGCR